MPIEFSPQFSSQFIDQEKRRLEEENADISETEIFQLLINVYGGINVAKYLTWKVEKLRDTAQNEIH